MGRSLLAGIRKLVWIGKYALLPVLGGIFPIMFYYANNLGNLGIPPFSHLGDLFTALSLIALSLFLLFYLITKGQALSASIAGFILVIFFMPRGLVEVPKKIKMIFSYLKLQKMPAKGSLGYLADLSKGNDISNGGKRK